MSLSAPEVAAVPSPDTFDLLLVEQVGELLRIAVNLTRDQASAEDCVQETLLRALTQRQRIAQVANPAAYLTRMLINEFLGTQRRQHREAKRAAQLEVRESRRDDSEPSAVDLNLDLEAAVRTLPRIQRATLVLRFYLDLDPQEIAELMGVDTTTVRSNLARARQRLRQQLPTSDNVEESDHG